MTEKENPMEVSAALKLVRETENTAQNIISAAEVEAAGILKRAEAECAGVLSGARELAEKESAQIKERLRQEGLRRCLEIENSCETEVVRIKEKSVTLEEQAVRLLREKINK